MYIDISKSGKYSRTLIRESFRSGKKVKKRTIANLSKCSSQVIEAVRLALEDSDLSDESTIKQNKMEILSGKSVGAVFAAVHVGRICGVVSALGRGRQGKLAMWQIAARLIEQGSRLSAVRLHERHALANALDLKVGFCENHLYKNLEWLADNQEKIESRLFKKRHTGKETNLFLYDVTSSYFEGTQNALAAYGYNRDGKKGKMQIVVGLLCDNDGEPISVQVFSGNTSDVTTFGDQVKKVAERFGCKRVTFVGDRGMIKSMQQADLTQAGFSYITALTRSQIETLEKKGIIQLGLFDENLCEVGKDGKRYFLRRNPYRADEISKTRISKEASIEKFIEKKNRYLCDHKRASVDIALREFEQRIEKLRCCWLKVKVGCRSILLVNDAAELSSISRLDGCYVITTNLSSEMISAVDAHARYKDLSKVERAFRESKTGHLELRPIHVRTEKSTRGHVFVVMLAYILRREFERSWREIDITVSEGLACLSALSSVQVCPLAGMSVERIPKPQGLCGQLIDALGFSLPGKIISRNLNVSTKKTTRKRT